MISSWTKSLLLAVFPMVQKKLMSSIIYEATRQAMYEAIRTLDVPAEAVVADAMKLLILMIPVESIIKGDSKKANIAAASISCKGYARSIYEEP